MNDALSQHEQAERHAKALLPNVMQWQRSHLLWQAVYIKRIKPVPDPIMIKAIQAFTALVRANKLQYEDATVLNLTMDKLRDLLWNKLNSAERDWLINQL